MPEKVVVNVKSAFASKINWMEIVKVLFMVAALFGFGFAPEDQDAIVMAVTSVGAAITIILKTFFTKTVTPSSAPGPK